jgi:hypothetical protein
MDGRGKSKDGSKVKKKEGGKEGRVWKDDEKVRKEGR